jgi:hypothetical protein
MRIVAPTLAVIGLVSTMAPLHARTRHTPPHGSPARAVAVETTPVNVTKARTLFAKGASLVRTAQWAEAQAAFEESNKLRPHPITIYNIGACERALGRYTVAAATFQRALAFPATAGAEMSDSLIAETKTYLAELGRLLVHVDLTVAPADAAIAIDGRPLDAAPAKGDRPLLVAGRRTAGRGEPLPGGRAEVLLDPGTHLFSLSSKGFNDQVITKTFEPGKHVALELNLDKLPAELRVSSNEERSVVRIDQSDVGLTPVEVVRPAGLYNVRVEKPGFSAYETTINVNAGEAADISAKLSRTPVTQKWWFWTAAATAVAGMVVTTYYLTRSEPAAQRPPVNGGGLGWAVEVP